MIKKHVPSHTDLHDQPDLAYLPLQKDLMQNPLHKGCRQALIAMTFCPVQNHRIQLKMKQIGIQNRNRVVKGNSMVILFRY